MVAFEIHQAHAPLYDAVNFLWVEPLQSTAVALLQAHREALLVGDNEYASFGAHFYCAQNILCGSPLGVVEKECTTLVTKMVSA